MKVPDIYSEMLHEGGHNYIFMEYLIGEPLGVWNSTVLNNNQRHSLLNDLACFLLDLWTLPVDSLDLGGGQSSLSSMSDLYTILIILQVAIKVILHGSRVRLIVGSEEL